ncbi:TonB-dependent receptor plug domain-containing protein [Sinimarinibacterium sp. CAU 1509]|uniref:TonB-dependent receptor plug domain-containing protein n=1 Tax=Sinimarinibacterium sp. CAU 1509 TaxID=2562283 RepID=UPI00146F77A8|nr:TonB-dependent receptor [Sinimarinibacterium sp. CAU 1509]
MRAVPPFSLHRTITLILATFAIGTHAADDLAMDPPELLASAEIPAAFTLGSIEVEASRPELDTDSQVELGIDQIRAEDRQTVGAAISLAPGVYMGRVGARNEEVAHIRGFDLRQVPLFIDGIPVYVPYDGYVDLGRFTTSDLARIDIARGFGSLIYGANTLGGAINLVSRRPTEAFELDAGAQQDFSDDGDAIRSNVYANLGSRQGAWYGQLGVAYRDRDHDELPDDYTPTMVEDGGERDNSDSNDRRLSMKLGWTPRDGGEYVIGYNRQDGEKGTPPYAGTVDGVRARYWRWPAWDKQSAYLMTRTALGAHELKLRLYHDTFKNSLFSYDDATYTTITKPYAFRSRYDDYTNGAAVEGGIQAADSNRLRLAATWKDDIHREHNEGEPVRHFKDRSWTIAAEDTQALAPRWSLVTGLAHEARQSLQAQDYNSGTDTVSDFARDDNTALSGQIGVFFAASSATQLRATYAHRNRFPTIKDRYSYRLGTAIPNESLSTETADHFELGYVAQLLNALHADIALYTSGISDLIQQVSIDDSACNSPPCSQQQNVGKVRAQGVDMALHGGWHSLRYVLNYSYLDRSNRSDPGVELTDAPHHQGFASLSWDATPLWSLSANADALSGRYSSSDGRQRAAGFAVFGLSTRYHLTPEIALGLGVHNLADRLYEYSEGYPEPGRSYFVRVEAAL